MGLQRARVELRIWAELAGVVFICVTSSDRRENWKLCAGCGDVIGKQDAGTSSAADFAGSRVEIVQGDEVGLTSGRPHHVEAVNHIVVRAGKRWVYLEAVLCRVLSKGHVTGSSPGLLVYF